MTGPDSSPAPPTPDRPKPVYRALILDAAKNVLRTDILFAHTDAEALALAEASAWEFDVELWDGLRFIEQIAARSGQSSQAAGTADEVSLAAG